MPPRTCTRWPILSRTVTTDLVNTHAAVRGPATAAANALVRQVAGDPLGHFTPSVYETARLVAQAPWLTGHAARLSWLLGQQSAGGLWGGSGGLAVVDSLSALDALLAVPRTPAGAGKMTAAAVRSADALAALLGRPDLKVPETVAVELIVPWLVETINQRLARCGDHVLAGRRLPMPRGFDARLLRRVRERAARGALPERLWHSLEVTGPHGPGAAGVRPAGGALCCSPAATAVWAGPAAAMPQLEYLNMVQARHGGPVPPSAPLDVFERAWVVCALAGAGITFRLPAGIAGTLAEALGPEGAPAGIGMPPDADDTAAVVHSLALLGKPVSAEPLWQFETDDHFACYHGESTASVTANAHVLEAFGSSAGPADRHRRARQKISRWLVGQQAADGHWDDKWHASPYYASRTCAVALARYGLDCPAADSVRAAVRWTLGTQRPDGSWGQQAGTREETAYALQLLVHATPMGGVPAIGVPVAHGRRFLTQPAEHPSPPLLWQDKGFYAPLAVLRAEEIAALAVTRTVVP